MKGTGLPGCARARASTWANPPVSCRTLRWQQPLRWLHDRQIQIQGANTRESMWRTWRRGQANTRLPTGTLTTGSGRRDWDMDRGRTLGRRRTKSRTHSLKQWPSSHVYPFPFSSFSSTHFLYLSLYQGDCHQYMNQLSCQLMLKGSLLARSHPTQYKHSCWALYRNEIILLDVMNEK